MRSPWDDYDPGFMLPDPRLPQAPQMPPVSEPDYLGELSAPQVPMPDDFFSRLAMNTGGQGVQYDPGPRPTGLEFLLSALAGFANAKTRGAAQRIGAVQEQNKQSNENARALANRRWELARERRREGREMRELITNDAFRRDKLKQDAADRALALGNQAEYRRITAELMRERNDIARDRAGVGGAGGGGGAAGPTNGVAQTWAKRLQTGEVKLSQVPQALRTSVLEVAGTILPEKARNTIAEVNAARSILGSLADLSNKIPRGRGIGRLKAGAQSAVAGFKQSEGLGEDVANYDAMASGMLANISRATGERGVLTNQDIDRVKKNIPTTYDTDTVSRRKLANLDELFNQLQERAIKTYTTDMGNAGARVAAPAPDGLSDDAAYQEYLKMVGGK